MGGEGPDDWAAACAEALRRCKPVLLEYEPHAAAMAGLAVAAAAIKRMESGKRAVAMECAPSVLMMLVAAARDEPPDEAQA